MDLSTLEADFLQGLAGLVLMFLLYLMQRGSAWLKIKLSDAQKAEMEDVAAKALTWGVTQSETLIKAKGWDHAEVQNAVVAAATRYAVTKFPDAIKRTGLDLSNPEATAASIQDVMTLDLLTVRMSDVLMSTSGKRVDQRGGNPGGSD